MSTPPKWAVTKPDGETLVPDNFQKYMQLHREGTDHHEQSKALVIRLKAGSPIWKPLLPFKALRPDTYHTFTELDYLGPIAHLLFMHYPNGGIHWLKAFGHYL